MIGAVFDGQLMIAAINRPFVRSMARE